MKIKILFIIVNILILVLFSYFLNSELNCNIISKYQRIESLISYGNYTLIEKYRIKNGAYPKSIEEINLIDSFYTKDLLLVIKDSPWMDVYNDPFTNLNLKYMPLKIKDSIVDYIIYSVGYNIVDDNFSEINNFNEGLSKKIIFKEANFKYKWYYKFLILDGDIIIRRPKSQMIKGLFLIE